MNHYHLSWKKVWEGIIGEGYGILEADRLSSKPSFYRWGARDPGRLSCVLRAALEWTAELRGRGSLFPAPSCLPVAVAAAGLSPVPLLSSLYLAIF